MKSRNLACESLEQRDLLAGDTAAIFSDANGLYQVYSNQGRVVSTDLVSQTFVVESEHVSGKKVDAAGFRQADQFVYGILAANHNLARVGSNGVVEDLGAIAGLPGGPGSYNAGDFASDGLLYIRNSGDPDKLFGVNVDTMSVASTVLLSQEVTNIWDFAFNPVDERFYASRRNVENTLMTIELDGTVATVGNNGVSRQTFGTMYADAEGNVFGAVNQNGDIYQFDTTTGAATLVGYGPTAGANDGFSDSSKVLEFSALAIDDIFVEHGVAEVTGNLLRDTGAGSDSSGDGSQLTVSAVDSLLSLVGTPWLMSSGATLEVQSNGDFVYTPDAALTTPLPGESWSDSFDYSIANVSGVSDSAHVTITFTSRDANIFLDEVQGDDGDADEGHLVRGLDLLEDMQVSSALLGDVNGDGIEDQIFGSPQSDLARLVTGEAFVVFGSAEVSEVNWKTDALRSSHGGDGSLGFVLRGEQLDDLTGHSVGGGMDINGDGINDMVIGAKDADSDGLLNNGRAYVFFGQSGGYQAEYDLRDLMSEHGGDGSIGFVIHGLDSNDLLGDTMTLSDMNGDGLGDVVVSATNHDANGVNNAGETYVIYGRSTGFAAEFDLDGLRSLHGGDGTEGMIVHGAAAHDLSGSSLASGDFNDDGVEDLVIGATHANHGVVDTGAVYVVYGSSNGLPAEISLADLAGGDGSTGSVLYGAGESDFAGTSVASAGDFNGDGIDDLLVGAVGADVDGKQDAGRVYVAYGSVAGYGTELELGSFHQAHGGDGSTGFVINGIAADDRLGNAVSKSGDFNGDGMADISLGARNASRYGIDHAGESYVLFGQDDAAAEFELSQLQAENGGNGLLGLVITGRRHWDFTGDALANAGDINGDGFDDIIVIGHRVNPATDKHCYAEAYYIFGYASS